MLKIDEFLDRLEQLISHARRLPFSRNVLLDEEELHELIDQLRIGLPEEVKQAKWTIQEQQRLLNEAQDEAKRIISQASRRIEESSLEQEALRQAKLEARQIIKQAQSKAVKLERGADAYALAQLQQLEAHLGRMLGSVKRGVEQLSAKGGET